MIIVLEGNECCYKTTVAKKLSEQLNLEIVKGSSFELAMSSNEEMFTYMNDLLDRENIVVDRYIYSNLVYATLYPKFTILTEEQVNQLQLKMMKNNVLTVFLTAPDDVIMQRLSLRGDEHIQSSEEVMKIAKKYGEVMEDAGKTVSYFIMDSSQLNSSEIVDVLLEEIQTYIN